MHIKTIEWRNDKIRIIDQTKLPLKLAYLDIEDINSLVSAIKQLKVRGAPALGASAGLGLYLGLKNSKAKNFSEFKKHLEKVSKYIASSRPTARNLFWALERMKKIAYQNYLRPIKEIKNILLKEALNLLEEDRTICRKMAEFGEKLIKNGDTILTICNTGILATVDYGTALGVIYKAKEKGKKFRVFACETRPLLQGARLTSWELLQNKIDTTLICDNMAASLMQKGKIDIIFVGADRIACNGDTANKIGTYNLAVLAKFHRIPFYVVAPTSTFDLSIKNGRGIPIEERSNLEVIEIANKFIAPKNIKVYNPAFDVTPNELITGIVTEVGILRKPFKKSILKLKND
ncbi:MAG: S-methyl-5-thioribose-1-phosphate isomerase [Candidatus Omnitrophota bacterium]